MDFYAQELAIACISYGNSVCLSVMTRYRSKTRWERLRVFITW